MKIAIFFLSFLSFLVPAQEARTFHGNADLAEAGGVKARALDMARCRALRKAVEYAGVEVESVSETEDFTLAYDRVKVSSAGVVTGVEEIYADWDRGDQERVLVILHARVAEAQDMAQLRRRLANTVDDMALLLEKCGAKQIAVGAIVDAETGMYGEFSAEVREAIETAASDRGLEVVKKRGIKVDGQTKVEGQYSRKGAAIELSLQLRDAGDKKLETYKLALKSDEKTAGDLVPQNAGAIAPGLKEFTTLPRSQPFALKLVADRGNGGAYHHGEKVVLEVYCERDAYLQIYYLQADGILLRIFPNQFHSANKVQGGKVYRIPEAGYGFDFRVDCSICCGMEAIKAVASEKPLPEFEGEDLGYGMRALKVTPCDTVAACRQGRELAEASCTILTRK